MFRGTTHGRLDEKGRLAIPSKFRTQLKANDGPRLVVAPKKVAGVRALEVLPEADWLAAAEWIRTDLEPFSPQRETLELVYVGAAVACQPDSQGRILIPPNLRRLLQLADGEREVVIVGVGRAFRVLSLGNYERVVERYFEEGPPRPGAGGAVGG